MISAEQRETRDLLRARLVLVGRVLRCRRSVGALLEKYNVAMPAALSELPRLQAALHAEQQTSSRPDSTTRASPARSAPGHA